MSTYNWKFRSFAGVLQVVLESEEDILHLRELDLKLWSVLAMPVRGVFVKKETLEALDSDNDGFIRANEILNALDFLSSSLFSLAEVMREGSSVSLENIKDEEILLAARNILENGSEKSVDSSRLPEITTLLTKKNDYTPSSLRFLICRMIKEKKGKDEILDEIEKLRTSLLTAKKAFRGNFKATLQSVLAARKAFLAVEKKIDDFFLRERLFHYAPEAKNSLSDFKYDFKELKNSLLSEESASLKALPLSFSKDGGRLSLLSSINPAWQREMRTFYEKFVVPLRGETESVSEEEWKILKEKAASLKEIFEEAATYDLSKEDEGIFAASEDEISEKIEREKKEAKQRESLEKLKKLLLFRRDFFMVLKNYVNFEEFYSNRLSVFQSGVLYFDTRATSLCFEYTEETMHEKLDIFSGAYLLYCDIFRGKEKRKILALITSGGQENITAWRNGVFYDREGRDWQANVVKILQNPISIKEAFFTPYRSFARMIENMISKKADAVEQKGESLIALAGKKNEGEKENTAKKIDLGTIALIGTAVGGISTLVLGVFRQAIDLGFYLPVAILAIISVISGPSMILAALKLRKRSITPILEANGWALNARLKINIPLGGALTEQGSFPPSAHLALTDPFLQKKHGWRNLFILALAMAIFFCLFFFRAQCKDFFLHLVDEIMNKA